MATSVRLEPALEKRLDFLVKKTGRSKAFYLRELIAQGMQDLEDYYMAADVLEAVRKGEERIYSEADVRKSLGLDH